LISCAACAAVDASPVETADLATETSMLLARNALNPNGLNPAALGASALARNILGEGHLAPSVVAALSDSGEIGASARELFRYTIECALDETQGFRHVWTDALGVLHDEVYPGLLGLASSWTEAPLSAAGQQWVSACIAARVNWYGRSVVVSSRSWHAAMRSPPPPELALYSREEGAFWGDLFEEPPRLFACHHTPNDTNSRGHHRECATGHVDPRTSLLQECGIIHITGSCDARCIGRDPTGRARLGCADGAGRWWSRVITTFLPD
jgi:hypothetical protein